MAYNFWIFNHKMQQLDPMDDAAYIPQCEIWACYHFDNRTVKLFVLQETNSDKHEYLPVCDVYPQHKRGVHTHTHYKISTALQPNSSEESNFKVIRFSRSINTCLGHISILNVGDKMPHRVQQWAAHFFHSLHVLDRLICAWQRLAGVTAALTARRWGGATNKIAILHRKNSSI